MENNFLDNNTIKQDISREEKIVNINRKLWGWLTWWLIFMMIWFIFSLQQYLFNIPALQEFYPDKPTWIFQLLAILSIFWIICNIAIFKWRKIWVYWIILMTFIVFFINLNLVGIVSSIIGLIWVVILILLIRPKWNLFY